MKTAIESLSFSPGVKAPRARPGRAMRAAPVKWHWAQTLSRCSAGKLAGLTMFRLPGAAACFSPGPWQRSQVTPLSTNGREGLAWHWRHAGSTARVSSG
jgi:hypothetical protein